MRNTRKTPTFANKKDALLGLFVFTPNQEDCFGVEFDPAAPECLRCHDAHACALALQYDTKQASLAAEAAHGPFLDQTTFCDAAEIVRDLVPGVTLFADIWRRCAPLCVCPDQDTLMFHIKSVLVDAGYVVKKGVVCRA